MFRLGYGVVNKISILQSRMARSEKPHFYELQQFQKKIRLRNNNTDTYF